MRQKHYICEHCGNIAALVRNTDVPIMCCGEKMQEMIPCTAEVSGEKHRPVYQADGNTIHVTVGSVEHPMTKEHYIEWICLETVQSVQYAYLNPTDKPAARFALCEGDDVRAVYAFCNQHDLWKN